MELNLHLKLNVGSYSVPNLTFYGILKKFFAFSMV